MKKLVSLIILLAIFFSPAMISAATHDMTQNVIGQGYKTFGNAAYGQQDMKWPQAIAAIVKLALYLMASIFLIIVIYGGFTWMTAGGSEEKVTKARNMLTNGIIGVIIIFSAYVITVYILRMLADAVNNKLQ